MPVLEDRPPFKDLLQARWDVDAFVCVGLDPDLSKMPLESLGFSDAGLKLIKAAREMLLGPDTRYDPSYDTWTKEGVLAFLKPIILSTKDSAAAFKPNTAFFEGLGLNGYEILSEVIDFIHEHAPEVPVILDCKRGDIGNTNAGSVRMAFDILGADAVTINPYMGAEAMEPFLARSDKGVFVLVRTSNPGAGEFQDLPVIEHKDRGTTEEELYRKVARRITYGPWKANGNCGAVVGATAPAELQGTRAILGDDGIILIPGVGAQGGNAEEAVQAGANKCGDGFVINSSSAILYASAEEDFAKAAGRAAAELNAAIVAVLAAMFAQ